MDYDTDKSEPDSESEEGKYGKWDLVETVVEYIASIKCGEKRRFLRKSFADIHPHEQDFILRMRLRMEKQGLWNIPN
jgi:hypothetical protein